MKYNQKYCCKDLQYNDGIAVDLFNGSWCIPHLGSNLDWDTVHINFCPWCGAKL